MPLKTTRIVTNDVAKKKKTDIIIVDVAGEAVTTYNAAVTAKKTAEAQVLESGHKLKELGLPELYALAIANVDTPPSSIKLRDSLGAVVRLTSQDKYGVVDPEATDLVFNNLGGDINDFVQFSVKASFNAGVFLAAAGASAAGAVGDFSPKIYAVYKKAIEQATAQLIKEGLLAPETPSPLGTAKVATVKPDFHARRYRAFPAVPQQVQLSEVISNTVTLTPVIDE